MLLHPEWKAEDQPRVQDRTSCGNNNAYNKNGNIPGWMFREKSNQKEPRKLFRRRKTLRKNQPSPRKMISVLDWMSKRPYLKRSVSLDQMASPRAKKCDKIHPMKVKESMSSVDKSAKKDLHKKDSTFDYVGKLMVRENYVGKFFVNNG